MVAAERTNFSINCVIVLKAVPFVTFHFELLRFEPAIYTNPTYVCKYKHVHRMGSL